MDFRANIWISLALCIILVGCGGGAQSWRGGQVVHIGNGAEPEDIDPHVVTGVPEQHISLALFEGLVTLDPKTLEPAPGVAERWEVSGDGMVYTFHLRDDARWSNGDPVTAHDFLYAWQRILTPSLGSEYVYMLFCMENARAFYEGGVKDFDEVGAEAPDAHTVRVRLAYPAPYFLTLQVHQTWFPVPQQVIERFGAMDEPNTRWTRPGNFVSNGPFQLAAWEPDRKLVAERNPYYWNAENVKPDAVIFYPVDNIGTEELLYRVGRLDLTESTPANRVDYYMRERPEDLRIDPYLGTYYYRVNVTKPPLDDPRVRRAFSMAVDREDLVRNVVRAGRKPAPYYVPPNTAGYTCRTEVPFDPEVARALLAEAGYPNGEGLPEVEILYNTSDDHKQIAEALQSMWRKHLNADVTLANQEWRVYLDTMNRLDYQMARSGWIGDFVDPINFLECFTTGNGNNRTGWSSKAYDELIAKARRTAEPAERREVMQTAEKLLLEEAPIIPLYFYTRTFLKDPALQGLAPNLLGYIQYQDLYFEEEAAE